MKPVRAALDTAALALLALLALAPMYSAYLSSQFWIAALGGVALGALIAVLGARLRWAVLSVAALTLIGYFVFGGVLVFRNQSMFGVVPTFDVLTSLALGAVQVWKQVLTLQAPFAGFDQLALAPYIGGLVASVTAVSVGLRARRFALALIAPAMLLVFSIAFSTYDAFYPGVIGALFGAVALGWSVWRVRRHRSELTAEPLDDARAASRTRLTAGLAVTGVVLVAGLAGAAGASAVAGDDREVLRDHVVPPLELHDYATPLASFRHLIRDDEQTTLFTISGLPDGAPVRLATLDLYDGIVYKVSGGGGAGSGEFTRVGRQIETDAVGTAVQATVRVGELGGVWMPTAGYLTELGFTGGDAETLSEQLHYNTATGTAVLTGGLAADEEYRFTAVVPTAPTEQQLAGAQLEAISTPTPLVVPAEVSALLETVVAGQTEPIGQLQAIERYFQTAGFFSHGLEEQAPSRSGHGSGRLSSLLGADQMIGDDEQYAVAMALMASQLGIPSRVVMGFTPSAGGDDIAVTGADLHVWVEAPFADLGWVAFSPTPPKDQVPIAQAPQERQKPRVQVAQPPDTPQEPAELPPAPPIEEATADEQPADWSWLWQTLQISGISLLVLLILVGPSIALAIARGRTRRRRRRAGTPVDRVGGGWTELLDAATDVGAPVVVGATRREQASALDDVYPGSGVAVLAQRADAAVFGVGDPSTAEVDGYWADVETATKRIGAAAPWHRRLRAAMFPASVLRRLRFGRAPRTTKESR